MSADSQELASFDSYRHFLKALREINSGFHSMRTDDNITLHLTCALTDVNSFIDSFEIQDKVPNPVTIGGVVLTTVIHFEAF